MKNFNLLRLATVLAFFAAIFTTVNSAQAGIVYMRSTVGQPFGANTNEAAMDTTFGAGNWQDLRYETTNPTSVFSNANSFAFLEGGGNNADELESFLNNNLPAIESWVSAGGSLFLNAAPTEGDGMNFGFGGTTLNWAPSFIFGTPISFAGLATNFAHPIFNGPNPTLGALGGLTLSNGDITGGGITPLMSGIPAGNTILAEKSFGFGHVMFGTMTTTNLHFPNHSAFNLRANILTYGASLANQGNSQQPNNTVPEPTTLAVFGFIACVAGCESRSRRRRRVAHVA